MWQTAVLQTSCPIWLAVKTQRLRKVAGFPILRGLECRLSHCLKKALAQQFPTNLEDRFRKSQALQVRGSPAKTLLRKVPILPARFRRERLVAPNKTKAFQRAHGLATALPIKRHPNPILRPALI